MTRSPVEGPLAEILTAERSALNTVQHLSGIATMTRAYVEAMHGHATLLDTRKTIPGLRALEKYATRMGGATNYRMGLWDAVMIKDNHIAAAGGIAAAFRAVLAAAPGVAVEVECDTLDPGRRGPGRGSRADPAGQHEPGPDLRSAVAMARGLPARQA